ncbi:MAG TPA: 30S ribosomal protein S8 [Patescibacteria group bacterium]|jgi:small subunit ribosomal protein S8|nr:30S ribosomal protein S8 [Patescibacteria group bacterium]
MYTDPISDMLTRIRNALAANKSELVMPYSKFKHSLANVLLAEGFISGVNELPGRVKTLQLNLKYDQAGGPVITGIKRVSTPGQRIYLPVARIPRTNGGFGITVVSTSKGLLTDKQARKDRLGGEVVCQVW